MLKKLLLKMKAFFRSPTELERYLSYATDVADVENRLRKYERDYHHLYK